MPTARTGELDTYFVRRGEGPPVVFVHGLFLSETTWAPQAEALADAYTTVAYDVRGHGHTGGSARESYSIELFADDLAALLDALDVERAVICGLSMGGAVAQAFAVAHPERVAGLALVDSFPPGPLPLGGRLAMANLRVLARIDRVVGYETLNRWQLRVGNWLSPGVAGDEATVQGLLEAAPRIPHAEVVKVADATAGFRHADLDLSTVTAPAVVLHGEHLPSAFEAMATLLAERLSNAAPERHVVPGGGHASNLDNPAFVTGRLRAFLEERAYPDHGGG